MRPWTGPEDSIPYVEQSSEALNCATAQYLGTLASTWVLRKLPRLENMKVKGKASIFVAFNDPTAKSLEPLRVETVLENMFEFVRDEAFAAFEPFL